MVPMIVQLSQSNYARSLRAAVRGLWGGTFTLSQFYEAMATAIERHIRAAWREGFAEFGIELDEMTDDEQIALLVFIGTQFNYINGLAQWVTTHSKSNGGKLRTAFLRVPVWANRYTDARNQAKTLAAGNQHLMWKLGRTEKHCTSCLKRGTIWREANIFPQSPDLECGGWLCDCDLLPTSNRATPGRLPSLP